MHTYSLPRFVTPVLCAFLVSIGAAGCGQTTPVGSRLAPPEIAFADTILAGEENGAGSASIDQFTDARPEKAIADYDGRAIEPTNDVVPTVRAGLENVLGKHGVIVSDSAPLVVSAEIRDWKASVSTGFNAKAAGRAAVFLRVFDPGNTLIHSGLYKGEANLSQSTIKEKDISEVLATAMSEALSQVVRDAALMKLFHSF